MLIPAQVVNWIVLHLGLVGGGERKIGITVHDNFDMQVNFGINTQTEWHTDIYIVCISCLAAYTLLLYDFKIQSNQL